MNFFFKLWAWCKKYMYVVDTVAQVTNTVYFFMQTDNDDNSHYTTSLLSVLPSGMSK